VSGTTQIASCQAAPEFETNTLQNNESSREDSSEAPPQTDESLLSGDGEDHFPFAIYHLPSGDARSPAHVKRQQHNVVSVSKPLSSEKD